jgi:hypothetical protein
MMKLDSINSTFLSLNVFLHLIILIDPFQVGIFHFIFITIHFYSYQVSPENANRIFTNSFLKFCCTPKCVATQHLEKRVIQICKKKCFFMFFMFSFCHFQEWYGLLSSSFAAVLLLSSSTLVAIVLIIQSELEIETSAIYASTVKLSSEPRKSSIKKSSIKTNTTTTTTPSSESSQTATDASDHNRSPSNSIRKQQKTAMKFPNLSSPNRGVKSAICLSWLLPILCAMCIPMIHKIVGHRSSEWWLELTSPDFIIFAITESLLVFLFVLLFVTLLKHLIYLSRKYEKVNVMLKKR